MSKQQFKRSSIGIAILLAYGGSVQAQTAAGEAGDMKVLPTVTVEASADASGAGLPKAYAGGQVARGGRLGILGNVDIMDAPFSSTIYTQTIIEDQQARSVADVMLSDPTVRVARGFGNYQELYVMRGFPLNSDDLAYNGLYGLLPRQFVSTELVERIEVLRGANAFLNGAAPGGSGIGGSINLLPKRAPSEPLTQVTAGVDGRQGFLAADVARRFGPDNSNGIRLNAARRDGETAVDDEERELSVLSVGLDHRGRNFRLSADIGYQKHDLEGARPSVFLAPGIAVPTAPDASSNFAQPWTFSNERATFGTIRGEVDLAENTTAWAAFGARDSEEANVLANPTVINAAGDTSTYRFDNTREDTVRTGEAGIRTKLRTGPVGHALSASVSAFELDSDNAYAFSSFAGFPSNLYTPVSVAPPAADFFTGGSLADPQRTLATELSSIAVADTLSFAQDRVLLTIGARHQTIKEKSFDFNSGALIESYDESRTTPVAGLVVKPMDKVSLYANYIEALTRGPIAGFPAVNAGQIFAPFRSKQVEIGAKYDAGKFGAGIAVFSTEQPQGVINPLTSVFGIDGEQRNRGVELTMYGAPVRNVRLVGGATFVDAEQRRTAGGLNDGRDVIGVPDVQASLTGEWDLPAVAGLTLNGRAIYTASQYADAANTQSIPSWTRLDAGVRYVTGFGKNMVTIRGQVENLADRDYWASAGGFPGFGYLVLGAPRTFVVSATIDF